MKKLQTTVKKTYSANGYAEHIVHRVWDGDEMNELQDNVLLEMKVPVHPQQSLWDFIEMSRYVSILNRIDYECESTPNTVTFQWTIKDNDNVRKHFQTLVASKIIGKEETKED